MDNAYLSTIGILLSLFLTGTSIASDNTGGVSISADNARNTVDQYAGHWIDNPNKPEASLPPAGRSLFDYLFTENKDGKLIYNIPYPYPELIKKIERHLQPDNLQASPVKQVLIPLGRSLARNIARPDFFLYPRVVSVVDTEPKVNGNQAGLMLTDRLYIGYGEAAQILEIISYNETAGRFEFQVVTDYKAGGKPKVFYANRELCRACHQNGALIFSRQQWDETNSNPRVAALLREHKENFYGIAVDKGVDIPAAIDAATDRANLFSLYQLLWQQGCESLAQNQHSTREAIQCRSNLLTYTLQYLLSGRSVFDYQSEYYQQNFLIPMKAIWKSRWPDGLLVADPDIPNRDPLLIKANLITFDKVDRNFSDSASGTLNSMLSGNDVSEKFEPLKFRPPLATWLFDTPNLDKTLISGLASFIPASDIQSLDQRLKSSSSVKTSKTELLCAMVEDTSTTSLQRIKFNCNTRNPDKERTISLTGRIVLDGNKWQNGKISRLEIDGQTQFDLTLKKIKGLNNRNNFTASMEIYTLGNFEQTSYLLTARTPDGNSIKSLDIDWRKNSSNNRISATITVRDDFQSIKKSIKKLAELTLENKSDVLSNRPFRRAAVMKALLVELGVKKSHWCCIDDSGMPAPKLQDPDNQAIIVTQAANAELAPFYHYCSICHRTSNNQPPNFLQGDEQQVTQKITQCAERIFFRLSMWQQNNNKRAKSPMPPDTALHKLGFTERRWIASDELLSLKYAVTKLIQTKTGKEPDIDHYIETGFDNLPECVPKI